MAFTTRQFGGRRLRTSVCRCVECTYDANEPIGESGPRQTSGAAVPVVVEFAMDGAHRAEGNRLGNQSRLYRRGFRVGLLE